MDPRGLLQDLAVVSCLAPVGQQAVQLGAWPDLLTILALRVSWRVLVCTLV